MDGWLSADTNPQPLVTYPLLGLGEHHRNQTSERSAKMDRNEAVNDNSIITVMLCLGDVDDDIRLGIGSSSSPSIVNTIPSFSS